MNKLMIAATAIAAQAYAGNYPRFDNLMKDYSDYNWEAVEVTTEDGYILTAFHIIGNVETTMDPVLFMHGSYIDGVDWFGYFWTKPLMLRLADAGYDVWIGNSRGTEYSQGHTSLTVDDDEYWNFSWAEMGLYDVPALITKMNESAGSEKSFYVGYSQGTIQMFYGLAHREEDFYADNVHKALMLAPCTTNFQFGDVSGWEDNLFQFPAAGIHSFYDKANWKKGKKNLRKICREFPDGCEDVKCKECQPVAVKSEIHWEQNAYANGTGRFQEFDEDWFDDVLPPLIPIDTIDKVPISMLIAGADAVCTPES